MGKSDASGLAPVKLSRASEARHQAGKREKHAQFVREKKIEKKQSGLLGGRGRGRVAPTRGHLTRTDIFFASALIGILLLLAAAALYVSRPLLTRDVSATTFTK